MKLIIFKSFFFLFLFISCKEKEETANLNINEKSELIKKDYIQVGFGINDTIESNKEIRFKVIVKDSRYNSNIKNNYFSHLYLSDTDSMTYESLLSPKPKGYYAELDTINQWTVTHIFKAKGEFTINGSFYVSTLEFREIPNNKDSLQVVRDSMIYYIQKKIFIK